MAEFYSTYFEFYLTSIFANAFKAVAFAFISVTWLNKYVSNIIPPTYSIKCTVSTIGNAIFNIKYASFNIKNGEVFNITSLKAPTGTFVITGMITMH